LFVEVGAPAAKVAFGAIVNRPAAANTDADIKRVATRARPRIFFMLFSYTSMHFIVSLWFTGIRSPSVDDTITSRAEVKALTFSLNSMVNHPRSQYPNANFMTLRHTRSSECGGL